MKKIKLLFPILSLGLVANSTLSILTTTSCSSTSKLESTKLYSVLDNDGKPETTTNISFFKDHNSIAYIEIKDAFTLCKYMHEHYYKDRSFNFSIKSDGHNRIITRENGSILTIDPDEETLTFSDWGLFLTPGEVKTEVIARNYGHYEDYKSDKVRYIAYGQQHNRIRTVTDTVLNLEPYGLDIVYDNGNVYLPFQTFSDIFLADIYAPLVVLKNAIVDVYQYPIIWYDDDKDTRDMPQWVRQQALDINQELLNFNYIETCFNLDHFFAFNQKRGYPSFNQLFTQFGYKQQMLESAQGFDEGLNKTVGLILDDGGHSAYTFHSPSNNSVFDKNTRVKSVYRQMSDANYNRLVAMKNSAGEGQATYDLDYVTYPIGTTGNNAAVINFNGFDEQKIDYYNSANLPSSLNDVKDALGLFYFAYTQIADDSNNITDVIVDLTTNGGGEELTAIYIASMLAGGEIVNCYKNTVDNAVNWCSFYADCNFDGKIDAKDQALKNKNVYVLTSNYSFSCASMLPNMLRNATNVTLIGKPTGGGACMVLPTSSAIGTRYQISSPYMEGYMKNGTFYDYDEGVPVAFDVDDSIIYNRTKLIDFLQNH